MSLSFCSARAEASSWSDLIRYCLRLRITAAAERTNPRREKAPSNPSLFPAPCSSGLLVRAHLHPGRLPLAGPAPVVPQRVRKRVRHRSSGTAPRRPFPKVWYPVTRLHSVDRRLSPKNLAPLGSVSFRGLRQHTDPATSGQRLSWERSGPTRNPSPVTKLRPRSLQTRRPCGHKVDNPVHDGPAYPQRARQWASGGRRSPVDSAAARRHEPGSRDCQDGVGRLGDPFFGGPFRAARAAPGHPCSAEPPANQTNRRRRPPPAPPPPAA